MLTASRLQLPVLMILHEVQGQITPLGSNGLSPTSLQMPVSARAAELKKNGQLLPYPEVKIMETGLIFNFALEDSPYYWAVFLQSPASARLQEFLQQLGNSLLKLIQQRSQPQQTLTPSFKQLLNSFRNGVFLINESGFIQDYNPAASLLLQAGQESLAGQEITRLLFTGQQRQKAQKEIQRFMRHNEGELASGEAVEWQGKRLSNAPWTLILQMTRLQDSAPPLFLLEIQDISERHHKEKKLRETKARLETMLEHLQVGVLLENAERDILMVNTPLLDWFGVSKSPDDLIGQPSQQIFEAAGPLFKEPSAFAQQLKTVVRQQNRRLDQVLELQAEKFLEQDYIPILFHQQVIGHFWAFREVTSKVQAEKERQILALFPQEDPNPIMRLDSSGKVLYANIPARYLLNYWHRDVGDFVPGFIQEVLERVLATGKTWSQEIPFGKRIFLVVVVPFQENAYANFYATDITERHKAEHEALEARDAALKASEAKSDFLAVMSHEIRTPLNAVLGMLEVLSRSSLDSEQHRYVNTSREAGRNLLALINNLLDFSRIEAGLMTLEQTPFRLRELIEQTFAIFALRAEDKGVKLEARIPENTPVWLKGDGRRLSQILYILLDNALKFTEKGHIRVQVLYAEPVADAWQLCLLVEDTGIGIPKEKQALVFESFQQADSSTTRKYGGSGLGLSIARQLVELFEGRIWIESEPGKGSQFFFTLRLFHPEAHEIEQVRQESHVYEPSQFRQKWQAAPKSLLVVEDSPENRLLIKAYLKDLPLQLHFAINGREAIEKWEQLQPDLILMDIQMPVLDGLSATREIRQRQQIHIPILALTADALTKTREACIEAGFDGFLTKPIEQSRLLQAVDQQLQQIQVDEQSSPLQPPSNSLQALQTINRPPFRLMPQLNSILPLFIKLRCEEPSQIRNWLDQAAWEEIKRLGHGLKGVGGSFGFDHISAIGKAIESAAASEDSEECLHWANELESYMIWVKQKLLEEQILTVEDLASHPQEA